VDEGHRIMELVAKWEEEAGGWRAEEGWWMMGFFVVGVGGVVRLESISRISSSCHSQPHPEKDKEDDSMKISSSQIRILKYRYSKSIRGPETRSRYRILVCEQEFRRRVISRLWFPKNRGCKKSVARVVEK
jgi:hypothetical protein